MTLAFEHDNTQYLTLASFCLPSFKSLNTWQWSGILCELCGGGKRVSSDIMQNTGSGNEL